MSDAPEHRRADLPLTPDQIMSDPRVKALVSYARHNKRCDLSSAFVDGKVCTCGFDTALAQLNEPKP